MTKESNHCRPNKTDVLFETDLEKKVHRLVSKMTFFETIQIPFDIVDGIKREDLMKAVNKSARYNCMEISKKWTKDKKFLNVTAEV